MKANLLGIIGSIGITCVMANVADAATMKVPQQYGTIQAAVNAAREGDTVKVSPGTYREHVVLEGKAITIAGEIIVQNNRFDETPDQPAIRCELENVVDQSNIFVSDPETALSGFCTRDN